MRRHYPGARSRGGEAEKLVDKSTQEIMEDGLSQEKGEASRGGKQPFKGASAVIMVAVVRRFMKKGAFAPCF